MPRTPEETRALFDRWADAYDAARAGSGGSAAGPLAGYEESLREAAALVPISAGARVLDVGIGTGAFAALLAARGARIAGVDVSPRMLARCGEAHPDFALAEGSFAALPFPDAAFDAAVSSFAFHEVPPAEREAACAELARVVKPGGRVCLLDIMFASPRSRDAARKAVGATWDDDEDYPLVADLDAALLAAGFHNTFWRQTAPCHWMVIARRVTA